MDLSQSETGAYIRLLCHQWNRGSIPVDTEKQQRLACGSVSADVISKFELCPDGLLRNRRLEQVREKQNAFRHSQSEKGKKSAAKRNPGSTPVQPNNQPTSNSPSPSPTPNDIETRDALPVELPPGFPATEADAKTQAATAGVPEDFAAQVWNKAMSRGGTDAKGQPVRSFRHYLAIEFSYERQRTTQQNTTGKSGDRRGVDRSKGTLNEGTAGDYAKV